MFSKVNIHIVSHTHWDREWYFSTSDSLVLLDGTLRDILNELKTNEAINFTLDGQVSILEDYLKLNPQDLPEIKKYVAEGRLFIGPWYTQTDTQLINGNSIVNNMYYGIYLSKKLVNDYMKVGYLPDTFGFSNQMPMIMNQFNIDNIIFWRGANFNKQNIQPYFTWIGQDDSKVTAIVLHNGYGMAKGFNNSRIFIEKKLKPLVDEFKALTNSDHILIPVGNDQNNIIVDLDKKIAKAGNNFRISNYSEFINKIKGTLKTSYKGEFRETSYTRVHKTSGAIRIDIKNSNYKAEIAILRGLEPLNAMARFEGMGVSDNLVYEAWKKLFEGQAHDGIVGCVSDSVAEDILVRNKQALEIAESSQNYIKKQFSEKIGLKEEQILLFNLDPKEFCGYKEIEIFSKHEAIEIKGVESFSILESKIFKGNPEALVEKSEGNYYEKEDDYYLHKILIKVELPAFGYRVFDFNKSTPTRKKSNKFIENEKFKIELDGNNLKLIEKNKITNNFLTLIDDGNEGDTYDFSAIKGDTPIEYKNDRARVEISETNQRMIVTATARLPYDLKERIQKKTSVNSEAKIIIDLRDQGGIRIKVIYDNNVLCHRLRLKIKRKLNYHPKYSLASTPFGTIKRKILNGNIESNWQKRNVEIPIDIETNSGFVALCGDNEQLTVFNKGIKEYQAYEDSIIMTLFSSTDELGKPNLLYRPGRASGDTTKKGHVRFKTPRAQVLGRHVFELMIDTLKNDEEILYKKLYDYETPAVFYQNQKINLFHERIDNKIQLIPSNKELPSVKSYLELSDEIYVESIYNSLIDGKIKVRFRTFKDTNKQLLGFDENCKVGNLLEEGDESKIVAHRLYTLRNLMDKIQGSNNLVKGKRIYED